MTVAGKNKEEEKLDFNVIKVTLTFADFDPWVFKFYRQLSEEVKKAKEEFYGLNEEEQKEKVVPHRIKQLSMILIEEPKNVPEVSGAKDFRKAFVDFFTKQEDIMAWLWSEYQRKLYPKELSSSPSE